MAGGFTNSYSLRDVEFIGGPYDGFVQAMATPEPFVCLESMRVKPTFLQILKGMLTWRTATPTSVAIYELDANDDCYRYRYIGSRIQNGVASKQVRS